MKNSSIIIILTLAITCGSAAAQSPLISPGNLGIKTNNPVKALQIGEFASGTGENQLLIPGQYNFEQVRFGQIGNGNSALEFINHIGVTNSYGIRFLVDTDNAAKGLQLQYAGSSSSYEALSYQTGLYMNPQGGIGINTTTVPSNYRLAVNGNIISESITVKLKSAWPDYVFHQKYKLPSLQTIEKHISLNGHLPGIPSAAEVQNMGVNLGEMNIKLLEKIEESTLYLIEQNKKIEKLTRKVNFLELEIKRIIKVTPNKKHSRNSLKI